jgi:hypothetical protein
MSNQPPIVHEHASRSRLEHSPSPPGRNNNNNVPRSGSPLGNMARGFLRGLNHVDNMFNNRRRDSSPFHNNNLSADRSDTSPFLHHSDDDRERNDNSFIARRSIEPPGNIYNPTQYNNVSSSSLSQILSVVLALLLVISTTLFVVLRLIPPMHLSFTLTVETVLLAMTMPVILPLSNALMMLTPAPAVVTNTAIVAMTTMPIAPSTTTALHVTTTTINTEIPMPEMCPTMSHAPAKVLHTVDHLLSLLALLLIRLLVRLILASLVLAPTLSYPSTIVVNLALVISTRIMLVPPKLLPRSSSSPFARLTLSSTPKLAPPPSQRLLPPIVSALPTH